MTGGVFTITVTAPSRAAASADADADTYTDAGSDAVVIWDRKRDGGFPGSYIYHTHIMLI